MDRVLSEVPPYFAKDLLLSCLLEGIDVIYKNLFVAYGNTLVISV